MIRLKTKEEIKILREGGKILADVLDQVVKKAVVGANTEDLEALALQLIEDAGGRPAFKGHEMHNGEVFPSSLCISVNDEVVHAPAFPGRVLNNGDIVGIDVGMEYPIDEKHRAGRIKNKFSKLGGYYTDMARTVIIGDVDEKTRKLVNTTKECLDLALKKVKPGATLQEIGASIQKHAEERGFSVVRELVGHGVGHDVHEDPQVPNYDIKDGSMENVVLKPGMVIAIEPMVNIGDWRVETGEDDLSIVTADGSLSAHFEHTVAVTDDGSEIITKL